MLANGATLSYKSGNDFVNIPGLKEIPEMGADPEKVDNTCLTDTVRKYDMGIGDPGEMTYRWKFDNNTGGSYAILRSLDDKQPHEFKEVLSDGTTTTFTAVISVKRGGADVNGVIDVTATMALQSDLAITKE